MDTWRELVNAILNISSAMKRGKFLAKLNNWKYLRNDISAWVYSVSSLHVSQLSFVRRSASLLCAVIWIQKYTDNEV
jgi:hypothetical protein